MSKLFSLRKGSGPLLLLLHGIGASATAWTKQIERLGPHFECVAPDLPGYGESDDADEPGIDHIVDRVRALLDRQPAHVVGVSFGALTALGLARQNPELVRSLVLADATLGRASLPDEQRHAWLAKRCEIGADLAGRSLERAAQIAAPGASSDVVLDIAQAMRRARGPGYVNVAKTIIATDAGPWLRELVQPTLVICGEEDGVTGMDVSVRISRDVKGARMVTIADAGHAPHIERPDAFAQCVLQFLRGQEDGIA